MSANEIWIVIISEQQLIDELFENQLIDKDTRAIVDDSGSVCSRITNLERCIGQGLIASDKVIPFIQSRVRLLSSDELSPEPDAVKKIPYKYASYYGLLPLKFADNVLHCALANPFDTALKQEIETVLETSIEPVWAFNEDIQEAIKRSYGLGAQIGEEARPSQATAAPPVDVADYSVKLVEELLVDALTKRATDIHIEPYENKVRARYRVDGVLYEQNLTDSVVRNRESVVARLKVLANLNLADKRKPQDGRIKTRIKEHEFDLRISVLPTEYGETVDIRLLNKNQVNLPLAELGFSETDYSFIQTALSSQHGIILVTGPTGSGKTTTLYNFLRQLNDPGRKILTIEDPIEYQLDGITQLQVNPQINFTFANGLRSMLRHDPDIMMVGEIRDSETAKIAIQVALTGHLVFSTLHTNDSISTLTRLQDMGVERYLLNATLECVIAQRLVRCICPACKAESSTPAPNVDFPTFEGGGCARCNHTGYFGRTGVFEIFQLDHDIKDMIGSNKPLAKIKDYALDAGMRTLYQSGMEKVKAGITTHTEVLRILQSMR